MRDFLNRHVPVFAPEGGDGGAPPENSNGDGGTWTPPEGFPADYVGADANESLSKLMGGYTDLSKRFDGMREKISKLPSAPEKAELYAFEPGEKLAPYFGDLSQNPAFAAARQAAHKYGLSQEQFAGFISDTYGPLAEQGVLAQPYNPQAELDSFMKLTGSDKAKAQESILASEAFAKGVSSQLKGIPDAVKPDVEAMLMGMTDTAAGNILLSALSGRLSESGFRLAGGVTQGALSEADLRKMTADPRIDPRNRDHADVNKRYDPELRKQYDQGFERLATQKK